MKHIKIITIFAIFCLTTAGIQAQSCYQIGLDEGKGIYGEALKLKNSAKCDEAAQQFWAALRRLRLTRRCADLPMNHELDSWEDQCINGITGCGWTIKSGATVANESIERLQLSVSQKSLAFDNTGGNKTIVVTTNAKAWRVIKSPSWLKTGQDKTTLYVTCEANAGTEYRTDVIVIAAGTLQTVVTITQDPAEKVNSCYEIGMSESRAMYNEAQRLQSIGEKEEAARQYYAAFKKVQETQEECKDIPDDDELETLKNNSSKGVTESGYIIENGGIVPQALSGSLQLLAFDEKGGEKTVTITSNAGEWKAIAYPAWCAIQQSGNRLTVTCNENANTGIRREDIIIVANLQQMVIPVIQAGRSCFDIGMSESRALFNDAQRLQSIGKMDEAAQQFLAAFKKAQETEENCEDIPEDNDLGVWTDNIAKSIEDLGYVVKGDRIVRKEKTPESDGQLHVIKSSLYMGQEKLNKESVLRIFAHHPDLFFRYQKANKKITWSTPLYIVGGVGTVAGIVWIIDDSNKNLSPEGPNRTTVITTLIGGVCLISGDVLNKVGRVHLRRIANEYNNSGNKVSFNVIVTGNELGVRLTF